MQIDTKEINKIKFAINKQLNETFELEKRASEQKKFLRKISKEAEKLLQRKAE